GRGRGGAGVRGADGARGVREEWVELARLVLYALDHRVDSSAVGHVGDNREAADLARDLFHLLLRAGADRNASARRGELPGDEGADSAPAAGDEGDLAVQLAFGSHRPRIRGGSPAGDSGATVPGRGLCQ